MCWRRQDGSLENSIWRWRAQNYFLNGRESLEPRVSKCGLQATEPVPVAL